MINILPQRPQSFFTELTENLSELRANLRELRANLCELRVNLCELRVNLSELRGKKNNSPDTLMQHLLKFVFESNPLLQDLPNMLLVPHKHHVVYGLETYIRYNAYRKDILA